LRGSVLLKNKTNKEVVMALLFLLVGGIYEKLFHKSGIAALGIIGHLDSGSLPGF
jgi:hypothetical protein